MEVNQERTERRKYSWCWFAKLIISFLDKIPGLSLTGSFSSTHHCLASPSPVVSLRPGSSHDAFTACSNALKPLNQLLSSIGYVTHWHFLVNGTVCHGITCPSVWWHHGHTFSAGEQGLLLMCHQAVATSAAGPGTKPSGTSAGFGANTMQTRGAVSDKRGWVIEAGKSGLYDHIIFLTCPHSASWWEQGTCLQD